MSERDCADSDDHRVAVVGVKLPQDGPVLGVVSDRDAPQGRIGEATTSDPGVRRVRFEDVKDVIDPVGQAGRGGVGDELVEDCERLRLHLEHRHGGQVTIRSAQTGNSGEKG